tara:strand:- start:896 stop:1000 length:105 start_codon:yes stop_codon:yes gene_type:complete
MGKLSEKKKNTTRRDKVLNLNLQLLKEINTCEKN